MHLVVPRRSTPTPLPPTRCCAQAVHARQPNTQWKVKMGLFGRGQQTLVVEATAAIRQVGPVWGRTACLFLSQILNPDFCPNLHPKPYCGAAPVQHHAFFSPNPKP